MSTDDCFFQQFSYFDNSHEGKVDKEGSQVGHLPAFESLLHQFTTFSWYGTTQRPP